MTWFLVELRFVAPDLEAPIVISGYHIPRTGELVEIALPTGDDVADIRTIRRRVADVRWHIAVEAVTIRLGREEW